METGIQSAAAAEPKVFAMSLPESMCKAYVVVQSQPATKHHTAARSLPLVE